jgi:uncharacterized RDD family membrane protein YckC
MGVGLPDASLPRPASLPRRLGAMVYDAMIVLALWLLTLFVGVAVHNDAVSGPLVQTILFLELFAFFTYFWVWRGQTIGMLAWGLRVETESGVPMRLSQALLRFVGALLAFACVGVGYLWVFVDPDRRAWPDMLSKTFIVHRPRFN